MAMVRFRTIDDASRKDGDRERTVRIKRELEVARRNGRWHSTIEIATAKDIGRVRLVLAQRHFYAPTDRHTHKATTVVDQDTGGQEPGGHGLVAGEGLCQV